MLPVSPIVIPAAVQSDSCWIANLLRIKKLYQTELLMEITGDYLNFFFMCVIAIAATLAILGIVSFFRDAEKRQASRAYTALVYQIWQAQTRYLDLKDADCEAGTPGAVSAFEAQNRLLPLLERAQEHRETARAWLGLDRMGSYSVLQQSEFGLAALANFRHEARQLARGF